MSWVRAPSATPNKKIPSAGMHWGFLLFRCQGCRIFASAMAGDGGWECALVRTCRLSGRNRWPDLGVPVAVAFRRRPCRLDAAALLARPDPSVHEYVCGPRDFMDHVIEINTGRDCAASAFPKATRRTCACSLQRNFPGATGPPPWLFRQWTESGFGSSRARALLCADVVP